jgi:large subunit ribosomal protein L40e
VSGNLWFLSKVTLMARFPEAEARTLNKKICMNCYVRNPPKATRCRKCRSTELRVKAKEGRGV